jgi:tRNA G18 (ribose-2'-O)-methylase SpoU
VRKLASSEIARVDADALAGLPRHPIVVVLDDIRSAHNVGSILRTSDAARVERVVCCGYTPAPDHPAVRKTALGAESTVPWETARDAADALAALRSEGFTLVALEHTDVSTPLGLVATSAFPLALVVGNEVTGVDQRVLDACDAAIELPQYGAKHSLNVSVAYGIAVYGLLERLPPEGRIPTG